MAMAIPSPTAAAARVSLPLGTDPKIAAQAL
jgi:hypothetical protein